MKYGLGKSNSALANLPNAGVQISAVPIRLENIVLTNILAVVNFVALFDSAVAIVATTPIIFSIKLPAAAAAVNSPQYIWNSDAPLEFVNGLYIVASGAAAAVALQGAVSIQYAIRYRNLTFV